jgi:diaminopimelate dehydrogenase
MKRIRFAVIGLGKLGRKCAEAILADESLTLAGIVRRPQSLPGSLPKIPAVAHISELKEIDVALVCVPPDAVRSVVADIIQRRIPVVECARLHGDAFLKHKAEIHKVALHHKLPAIVGAGCDPGALSLFRSFFALLAPRGHTETTLHTGSSLHHTLAASGVKGVRKALATERQASDKTMQRYVYVELEPSADAGSVEKTIANDPLFLGEQTLVFPVASVAALEEADRGLLMERHAAPEEGSHASFLLEARFDETRLAARMMLAAARALPMLQPGAFSLFDLPPGALWGGERRQAEEKEWL